MNRPGRWTLADAAALFGVATVALLASLACLHRAGIADADAMVMAAGLAHGLQPGVPFRESLLYGWLISPGFYSLFHAVAPWTAADRDLIGALNLVGVKGAAVTAAALFLLFRGTLGRSAAAACALIAALAPVAWENGTSFHPIGLALPLFAIATLSFAHAERSRWRWAWWGIATALAANALLMRNEIAIAFPAALLAAWLSPGRGRTLARAALAIAIALGAYLLAVRGMASTLGGGSVAGWASGFARSYLAPSAIAHSVVWAGFTLGIATVALAGLGVARLARDPETSVRREFAVALALAIPATVLWLPNTTAVLRHYLFALPALVWLAGAAWLRRLKSAALVLATLAIVAINLVLPEALYATWNRARPGAARWPNGTFVSSHRLTEQAMVRANAAEAAVLRGLDDSSAHGVFAQVDWRGFGHVLFGLARRDPAYRAVSTEAPFPGAVITTYRLGDREVRLLLAQFAWAENAAPEHALLQRTLAAELDVARARGLRVVLPGEDANAGLVPSEPGVAIERY